MLVVILTWYHSNRLYTKRVVHTFGEMAQFATNTSSHVQIPSWGTKGKLGATRTWREERVCYWGWLHGLNSLIRGKYFYMSANGKATELAKCKMPSSRWDIHLTWLCATAAPCSCVTHRLQLPMLCSHHTKNGLNSIPK